ncbi:TPA: hypothetical protein U6346_002570 [Legionella pneumophila]|nr:hypothetical protein [Legionella pneumophila]
MAKEKQLWFAQPYRVSYFALQKSHGDSHESKGITSAKNRMWDCYACFKRITSLGMPVSVKVK